MSANDPYRRIAGVYDRLIEPMQSGVRRVALDVVPPQSGWQVLDVGCGTGSGLVPYVAAAFEPAMPLREDKPRQASDEVRRRQPDRIRVVPNVRHDELQHRIATAAVAAAGKVVDTTAGRTRLTDIEGNELEFVSEL